MYCGDKQFSDWAENIRNNIRKDKAEFLPTSVSRSNNGVLLGQTQMYLITMALHHQIEWIRKIGSSEINHYGKVNPRLESTIGINHRKKAKEQVHSGVHN